MATIKMQPIIAPLPTEDLEAFISLARRELEASSRKMLDKLATYPAYKHVSWKELGGFVSDKQRRYVMANIRKGVIQVPRPRTGTLGRSWSLKEESRRDKIVFVIGSSSNIAPYDRYVQQQANQAERHKRIGWDTAKEVAQKMWPRERQRIQNRLRQFRSRGR